MKTKIGNWNWADSLLEFIVKKRLMETNPYEYKGVEGLQGDQNKLELSMYQWLFKYVLIRHLQPLGCKMKVEKEMLEKIAHKLGYTSWPRLITEGNELLYNLHKWEVAVRRRADYNSYFDEAILLRHKNMISLLQLKVDLQKEDASTIADILNWLETDVIPALVAKPGHFDIKIDVLKRNPLSIPAVVEKQLHPPLAVHQPVNGQQGRSTTDHPAEAITPPAVAVGVPGGEEVGAPGYEVVGFPGAQDVAEAGPLPNDNQPIVANVNPVLDPEQRANIRKYKNFLHQLVKRKRTDIRREKFIIAQGKLQSARRQQVVREAIMEIEEAKAVLRQ